jgi:uncharacterized protein YjbI with pentapeptide repeats
MSTTDDTQPFPSLRDLQQASDQLIKELPQGDLSKADAATKEFVARIEKFVARAVVTGTVLDSPRERTAAQSLIDLWAGKIPRENRTRLSSRASELMDFDEKVVDPVPPADLFLSTLSTGDKKLLCRLLFLLIRFPQRGDVFGSTPQSRAELRTLGRPTRVDRLLDGMIKAGVLIIVDETGRLGLSYTALTRRWEWLNNELKERMAFRGLTLGWAESGGSSPLLSWWATRRYRWRYTNFNTLEQAFLNASARHGGQRIIIGFLVLVGVALSGLSFKDLYAEYYAPTRVASVTREIINRETSNTRKVENILWLAANLQRIDIPGVELKGTERKDMSGLRAAGANFRGSKLKGVDLNGAFLPGSVFVGGVIEQTGFRKASLARADFEAVDFCQDVDFTGADVYKTSFKRVKFSDRNIPKFGQSAWWQAYGWGFQEIEMLHKQYPRHGITETDKYKHEIGLTEESLRQASGQTARAVALNEKAWLLATYGVISDGQAEQAVREAVGIIGTGPLKEMVEDTLAYILLQKGQDDPALRARSVKEAFDLLQSAAKNFEDGEVIFRYAVALHASGAGGWREILRIALIEHQYDPSHELYLLKDHLNAEFHAAIAEMTRRGIRQVPRQCPLTP